MASVCNAGGGHASPHHIVKLEPTEAVSGVASWSSAPWPAGMKVLVVDDDPVCLKVVSQMLQKCNYTATTATNGTSALEKLRRNPENYDLVLSDVYMPDMDGFKLLEHVNFELNLPVIMMSSNGSVDVVLRGVTHGAVDFLIKPVRLEELRNAWQHVVRRKREKAAGRGDSSEREEDEAQLYSNDRKRKSDDKRKSIEGSDGETGNAKKARVVWSVEMHQQFVGAVNILGVDKAVPKRILDVMNVAGLTRENVASHLQKYRLYLRKMNNSSGARGKGSPSSMAPNSPQDPTMQFFHHQVTSSGAAEVQQAQQQSPLGLPTYGAAGVPYPMGMSMQEHHAAMGGIPDQLVRMQMQSLQLQQALSMGVARAPGLPAGVYGNLGSMGLPMGVLGGTAITRGLEYGAAPPPAQMPAGEGSTPAGNAEGADMNDIAWLLSGQDPAPDGMGQFMSSAPAAGSETHAAESSAAEVPTGSGDSGALHVNFDKSALRESAPSSSTHSSSVSGGNGAGAMHGQLPMTTADAALFPDLGRAASGNGGSSAAMDAMPGMQPPLGGAFEDEAGFVPPLLNPELFADSLLLASSQQRHVTEEPSDDMVLQRTHQLEFPHLGVSMPEVPSLVPLPHDARPSAEASLYSVPEQNHLFPQDAFAAAPRHQQQQQQQARGNQHQRPPLPKQPKQQQQEVGAREQQPSCDRGILADSAAGYQQQQQSMDEMLEFFLKDPDEA